MAFQRIAQTEIDAADNLGRDDTPNAGTAGMQQILDAYPNLIAKKFNLLVDSLDTEISSRYTKAETDAKIGAKVVEIGAGDMAKAVYDTNGDGVVNDSDNGIFVYTHTKSGRVHNFVFGSGLSSPANGKALMTAALSAGDTVQINGVAYPAFAGVDSVEELPAGRWVTFVFDGAQVNFKSGGAALNFKVVGGTAAPVNPQENTLWVNTDKPIAGWSFLCTQYTGTSPDGWVQIICGVTSTVSFNALKKSELIVYPVRCIQYLKGKWENLTAKTYQQGVWKSWAKYFYDNGIQEIPLQPGNVNGSVNFLAKHAQFTSPASGDSYSRNSNIFTSADISALSVIKAKLALISGFSQGEYPYVGICVGARGVSSVSIAKSEIGGSNGTEIVLSLDVSTVNGIQDIAVSLVTKQNAAEMHLLEWWGEY